MNRFLRRDTTLNKTELKNRLEDETEDNENMLVIAFKK